MPNSSVMSPRQAVAHLRSADPALAQLIGQVGPFRMQPRREGSHFQALARAIVYQQLSGKAAGTIHGRFAALFPGQEPAAVALLEFPEATLRAVGLSRQKISYLRDLAARTTAGELRLDHVERLPDDDLITHLVQVKGIGRWTAHMFLMFRLGRPDVLPELDLGIRNAVRRLYRLRSDPSPARILGIGARWAPFRTAASWYLWRSLDPN
jgi:3-methyladenine DNA glycosylase/8-oxoguanine DNA glycosylase